MSGRSLDPSCFERVSELLSFLLRDLSLYVQIALLANDDAGNCLCACVVENLVVDGLDHFEAGTEGNGVHEDVSVNSDGVA